MSVHKCTHKNCSDPSNYLQHLQVIAGISVTGGGPRICHNSFCEGQVRDLSRVQFCPVEGHWHTRQHNTVRIVPHILVRKAQMTFVN